MTNPEPRSGFEPTAWSPTSKRASSVIVVGLDGGPASLRAATCAVGVAQRQRARILFLQVWPQPTAHLPYTQLLPAGADGVDGLMATIDELVGPAGIGWELYQVVGHPVAELRRLGKRQDVDAIILGAPRHRARFLRPPSLTQTLIKSGRCPVIVIP